MSYLFKPHKRIENAEILVDQKYFYEIFSVL